MASKKNPASTPKKKASDAAVAKRRKDNRARNVSASSPNVNAISGNPPNISKKTIKKAQEEAEAEVKRLNVAGAASEAEATEVGDVDTAMRLAEADFGQRVDETPEEDAFISEGLVSGAEGRVGSGYTETSRTMAEAGRDAEKEIAKENEARAKALDVPSADLPVQRVSSEAEARRKAENLRGLEISRQRRADQARAAITPSFGPPVYRDIDNPDAPVSGATTVEDYGTGRQIPNRVIWSRDNQRIGRGTATRQARGRTVPLTKEDIQLSNQFYGFTPTSADSSPETLYGTDPDTGLMKAGKGTKRTFRLTRTRKTEDALLASEKRNQENDALLAEKLAEVAKAIPETVETGDSGYVAGKPGEEPQARALRRPGIAEDLDEDSPVLKTLREAASGAVTGFGEMGRAGQKRPAFGGTTSPGVSSQDKAKMFDRNSQVQDTLAAFRKLSGDQFIEMQEFAERARAAAEGMPSEWTPDRGANTTEGYTMEQANVPEDQATKIAEEMMSGSEIGRRSIPVMTAPEDWDPDQMAELKPQQLVEQINLQKDKLGGTEGIANLVEAINVPAGRFRTRTIETSASEPFSRALTDEDIEKIESVSGRPGSASNVHKSTKFLRRKAGVKAPATTSAAQDVDISMERAGQVQKLENMMSDFPGKGGGEPAQGHAIGSRSSMDLGKQKTSKKRPSRSVTVTNVNSKDGTALKKPETVSVSTGEPTYTENEIEDLKMNNPDLARVYDPVSDLRLPRAGGVPVPTTRSTLVGTDFTGAPSLRRLAMVRTGPSVSVQRAVSTPSGEGGMETPVEQTSVKQPISSPQVPSGSMYFPTLSGQFRQTREVTTETPGVRRDEFGNPVVTDAEALSKTPQARRALNERTRMAGISAAKEVSARRKAEDVEFGPGRPELGRARRVGAAEDVGSARADFLAQPAAVQKATRQDIFIQQPAVERQRSPMGAALLSDYAARTKQVFTDNPRFSTEGGSGEVIMRDNVLSGQSRENVMNKVVDQMKYASGYVAPSNVNNVYDKFKEVKNVYDSNRGLTPKNPLSRPSEDPRDTKPSALQSYSRDYGGAFGGPSSGSSVMEGDQWGAMRGAQVRHPGDRSRKPGAPGYRGLEGLNTPSQEDTQPPSIGTSVAASIGAQYGQSSRTPNFGVSNPRTTSLRNR